jgi:hypothetical protein
MKPSNAKKALLSCIKANRPCFLWGPPGVGKSSLVAQVADEMFGSPEAATPERPYLRDIRAVLLDPVDLRGLPSLNGDGHAHWAIPEFLPKAGEGLLFLDELNAAPRLVQAACYQLVLDRKIGEYTLPDGWVVVAAGNNDTDGAVTNRMPTALRNRFASHVNVDVDLDDFVAWALQADIATEVIAFNRFRPNLLHDFDPTRQDKAFATPRSWEFISDLMKTKPDADIEYDLYAGCVGEGAAAEFTGFLRIYRKMTSPDVVLNDPKSAPVPDDPATLYAMCGALAARASEQTFERIVTYANRLDPEFSVLIVRDSLKKDENLAKTRSFIEWASKNKDVMM